MKARILLLIKSSNHKKNLKYIMRQATNALYGVYNFRDVETEEDIDEKVDELISGGIFNLTKYQINAMKNIYYKALKLTEK